VKVLLTDWELGHEEPARRLLQRAGLSLDVATCASPEDIVAAAADAEALMIRHVPLPREALAELPQLRFVSRMGIGAWAVDVDAAVDCRVAVAHCPEYCTDEAVAHTVSLVLALNRRLGEARAAIAAGRWTTYGEDAPILPTSEVVLGLLGLGRMGQGMATVGRALGMDVIGYDPYVLATPEDVEQVDLATLLSDSDILCLLCPETFETKGLIDSAALAAMKPTACLVNTARGGLVDEAALLDALDRGELAGAALDVLAEEPPDLDHPLLSHPKVIVTPHVAYLSDQSQHELVVHSARNVVHYFTGEPVAGLLTPDFRRV
jgi:D-3-phosphoglycerate dehydrogenase